jgi:hypothetical protein
MQQTPEILEQQQAQTQRDQQNCLRSVSQQIEMTKQNDLAQGIFFLSLGLGMVLSKKYLSRFL